MSSVEEYKETSEKQNILDENFRVDVLGEENFLKKKDDITFVVNSEEGNLNDSLGDRGIDCFMQTKNEIERVLFVEYQETHIAELMHQLRLIQAYELPSLHPCSSFVSQKNLLQLPNDAMPARNDAELEEYITSLKVSLKEYRVHTIGEWAPRDFVYSPSQGFLIIPNFRYLIQRGRPMINVVSNILN
jgi:hypothetical protein